jgi:deoxyribonuclease-4
MSAVKDSSVRASSAATWRRHRFGAHLSIAGGMHCAIEKALHLHFDTVQVFVKNQRQWRAAPLDPADVARWHELRETPGFGPPVAHATYLINLASPRRSLAALSERAFTEELRRCAILAIPYLVFHPGSATGSARKPAVARVAHALDRVLARPIEPPVMPLLETTAGQGSTLGATFEELAEIIDQVEAAPRVGVCVDTCHVFAAGYNIRRPESYQAMIDLAARTVGLARIRCWHLNDSRAECGAHLDRHEHIGRGRLGRAAFGNLLADPRFLDVPMILETPKGTDRTGRDWDRVNLGRLREIDRHCK